MINGFHAIIYSTDPQADRAFFRGRGITDCAEMTETEAFPASNTLFFVYNRDVFRFEKRPRRLKQHAAHTVTVHGRAVAECSQKR